jgi:cyclophilin family peptidyl-prolyl cis-trans isomerase
MRLCSTGYYNGTKFHRSIRHFMVSWNQENVSWMRFW